MKGDRKQRDDFIDIVGIFVIVYNHVKYIYVYAYFMSIYLD